MRILFLLGNLFIYLHPFRRLNKERIFWQKIKKIILKFTCLALAIVKGAIKPILVLLLLIVSHLVGKELLLSISQSFISFLFSFKEINLIFSFLFNK